MSTRVRLRVVQVTANAAVLTLSLATLSTAARADQDQCTKSSTPLQCYESELQSLGRDRAAIESERASMKTTMAEKDAELTKLRVRLQSISVPTPETQFLSGTWCDSVNPTTRFAHNVTSVAGRDVLVIVGPAGVTAAHLFISQINGAWETKATLPPPAPNYPTATYTARYTRVDDNKIQVNGTTVPNGPLPPGAPPPQPFVGTLVRCQ